MVKINPGQASLLVGQWTYYVGTVHTDVQVEEMRRMMTGLGSSSSLTEQELVDMVSISILL